MMAMKLLSLCFLPLVAADCEASETSMFQADRFHSVPKAQIAAAAAANKDSLCVGAGPCFDLPALRGILKNGNTIFHHCSSVARTFMAVAGIMCDYTSTSNTLPQNMVEQNNFTDSFFQKVLVIAGAMGTGEAYTNYMPILSPDFFNATTFVPFAAQEYPFVIHFQADLDFRLSLFALAVRVAQPVTPTGIAHNAYTMVAKFINEDEHDDHAAPEFTQGNGDNWKNDTFAAQLIGHTFIAGMLEHTYSNIWILDLTGEGNSQAPMQGLKRMALAAAPKALLRARGFLEAASDGPKLTSIEVQLESGEFQTFGTGDGTKWTIAKVTLFAMANFVLQCFHTGIHLFAGAVTAAIKRAIPVATKFGLSIQPNTLQTIFALFEQAAALHSSHGSAFSGGVWDANITEIWTLTSEIARFYLRTSDPPQDILGITSSSPDWWAGKSESFYTPISDFAESVSAEVTTDPVDSSVLAKLQTELKYIGVWTNQTSMDVTTAAGLAKLTRNLLFVAGICHTHMYLGREYFTPLMGFVETSPFSYYLKPGWSIWDTLGFEALVTKIWITVPNTMLQQFILAYGTTSGFTRDVPQLGDGPYMFAMDSNLKPAVTNFQASLNASRAEIYAYFGGFQNGSFVPGYFYPVEVPKPFGYAITQTSYI